MLVIPALRKLRQEVNVIKDNLVAQKDPLKIKGSHAW
jgi:hypothetical protein